MTPKHLWLQMVWISITVFLGCAALNATMLDKRTGKNGFGRECDFSDGYYVSWDDTRDAIQKWCASHNDQTIEQGKSLDDGEVKGYKSGIWKVKLYGMCAP